MVTQAFANAELDAAAAAGQTEVATWYAATGFIPVVGGALATAALIIVGFVWLKATFFSAT